MKKTKIINISGIIAIILVVIFGAGYLLFSVRNTNSPMNSAAAQNAEKVQTSNSSAADENPFVKQNAGTEITNSIGKTSTEVFDIILRLTLAVILSGVLAFRPRKNIPLFQRNLYVAQTQILLAVVAAALMMIVGDNTARAFAIFAAVSLVRFRTNIRDPKEITVLLISLALGLAAGVGRWELGVALCLFAFALLWILEYNESEQVYRSMELTIKTHNTDLTQDSLKKIFNRYNLEAEVRQINPPDEAEPIGCIMYYLNLRLNLSTDFLSDKIFALDAENIDSIQWEQKKSVANVYQ